MHRPQVVLRQKLLFLGRWDTAHGPGTGGPAGAVLALTSTGSIQGLTHCLGDEARAGDAAP